MGEIPYDPDEDRVQCHLCGGWYRIIGGTHLIKVHGWTVQEYRERFGLLSADVTCAQGLSRRLSAVTTKRLASGDLKPPPTRQPPRKPGRQTPYRGSLASLRPDLIAELDPDRNPPGLNPARIAVKSGKPLWWRCPRCQHSWQTAPHERSRGHGCPECGRRRAQAAWRRVAEERSLHHLHPALAAELHPTRNPGIDARSLAPHSRQKVWWQCPNCQHEWRVDPGHRIRGSGCPACARRARDQRRAQVPEERSLAVKRPELAAELHPTKNPGIDPHATAARSNRPLWWLCPSCGNTWQTPPCNRQATGRCPQCRRRSDPRQRPHQPTPRTDDPTHLNAIVSSVAG